MATIKPFRALRPKPELAKQVASKPYDVLNSQEAKKEAAGNHYSFLRITKPEIDLPEGIDVYSQAVYAKAKQNLEQFMLNGVLFQEENPCYYIYRLVMNGQSQTGLVCLSSVDDYFNDVIRKHELTRPEKELDRIRHMKTIGAQTGNVFLACRDVEEINSLIRNWKNDHGPVYDFDAGDGIQHTIWIINEKEAISRLSGLFQSKLAHSYIADGHHRAASAAKVSAELPGNEEAKFFLTTIFPASELKILDYNRVVKDLNGLTPAEFLKNLGTDFIIEKTGHAFAPQQVHQFGMYLAGAWYKLLAKEGSYSPDPVGVLDVSILSNNILDSILGIKDQRTDKRIDFVGGIRGLEELEKRVNSGEMKLAFSLYPVSIQQLFEIADHGKIMPPKSTWFEPKLRDGLLTHLL